MRSLAGWLTAARGAEIRRLHPTVALFCPLTLLTLLYEGNVFVGSKRMANNKLALFIATETGLWPRKAIRSPTLPPD